MMCCVSWQGVGAQQTCTGFTLDSDPSVCVAGRGQWISMFSFQLTANWVQGSMVQNMQWQNRQMVPINQWVQTVDKKKLVQALQNVQVAVKAQPLQNFASCKLQPLLDVMAQLTSTKAEAATTSSSGSVKVTPGDSFQTSLGIGVQVTIRSTTVVSKTVQISVSAQSSQGLCAKARRPDGRRLLERKDLVRSDVGRFLQETVSTPTSNSTFSDQYTPSCYTLVKVRDKAVGQLIGDCAAFTFSAPLDAPGQICLQVDSAIPLNPDFTVDAFAYETAAQDGSTFLTVAPATVARSSDGVSLCGDIQEANTYCPIRRYADYTSASVVSADTSCTALTEAVTVAATLAETYQALGVTTMPGLVQVGPVIPTQPGSDFGVNGQVLNKTEFLSEATETPAVNISSFLEQLLGTAPSSTTPDLDMQGTTYGRPITSKRSNQVSCYLPTVPWLWVPLLLVTTACGSGRSDSL